jgi:putative ABC transport system permease protein
METLAGDADFEVTAAGGVAPEALTRLALLPYALKLDPRIEDYATIAGTNRTIPLIGVDMLGIGRGVWIGHDLPYKAGDHINLVINDHAADYTVGGVLGERSGEAIVMDLAEATRTLERNGNLDRILVRVPQSKPLDEWLATLRSAVPAGTTVEAQGTRTNENRRMLAAFRWNLRVLSYIALVVGAFLIYNTVSVSVVRRRAEIGIVRALGATRSTVMLAFLGEAAAFGLIGGLLGIVIGRLMAKSAVGLVAATVSSLYVSSTPAPIGLTWPVALLAIGIGLSISVLSSLAPAWEAAGVAPVEAMSRGRREHEVRMRKFRALTGSAVLAVAAWIASRQQPVGGKPLFGYISALLLIGSGALAIPAFVAAVSRATSVVVTKLFGVEALLAARSVSGSLRRTSVLTGALATAIAMTAAVGIMVGSFRQTVLLWMEDRLQADLYLRPAGPSGADRHPTMSPEVADRIAALSQVAAVDRFRAYQISYDGAPVTLGAGEARIAGRYGSRPILSGVRSRDVFARMIGVNNVIVSEPFANKHHVKAGDTLSLSLGGHGARFLVLDVYYDYSNELGYIIMDRGTLLKYLPDPAPSNMAVYLKPGISLEAGRRAVEQAATGRRVVVMSNRTLREEAIAIFDRTFAITYALEAVAVFVAVVGVAGALLALVIDRRREFGLLRFLGGAGSQVRRVILFEAGMLGLFANVAGLILGVFLSLLLIFVINKQSFGWTIQFHWPVAILLGALSIVYVATVMAGLYPGRIAARLNPIEVIHED